MAETSPLVNVQIDGVWHQFPKGTRVIEACAQLGVYIPRYCYHPKLSSPGNCRMCLIEMGLPRMGPDRKFELGADGKPIVNWMPRPQICCAQDVAEGMGVRTSSPLVDECRKGVMEFLLINHPLDCPICDQAGECELQDFTFQEGRSATRYSPDYAKRFNPVEDFGPDVLYVPNRCILCTRCVRFMEDVAHEPVLNVSERGDRAFIGVHPEARLDHPWAGNVVDLCPVGSLLSKDFLHKARAWELDKAASVCTGCSQG